MRLVIVESPYAASEPLRGGQPPLRPARSPRLPPQGESPIASHLLLTQPGVLDDNEPDERKLGILAGHAWFAVAQLCAVYTDYGVSFGMRTGMYAAEKFGVPISFRSIGK